VTKINRDSRQPGSHPRGMAACAPLGAGTGTHGGDTDDSFQHSPETAMTLITTSTSASTARPSNFSRPPMPPNLLDLPVPLITGASMSGPSGRAAQLTGQGQGHARAGNDYSPAPWCPPRRAAPTGSATEMEDLIDLTNDLDAPPDFAAPQWLVPPKSLAPPPPLPPGWGAPQPLPPIGTAPPPLPPKSS
jgi:hypothetical protein